jgi:hypothetical protein
VDYYKMDPRRSSELAAFKRFLAGGSGFVPAGYGFGVPGQTHGFSEL